MERKEKTADRDWMKGGTYEGRKKRKWVRGVKIGKEIRVKCRKRWKRKGEGMEREGKESLREAG